MTATREEAAAASNKSEGQIAPLLLGLGAVVAGLIGTFWIGMAGQVWRPWELGTTYHWDGSESSLRMRVGLFFFAGWAVMLSPGGSQPTWGL